MPDAPIRFADIEIDPHARELRRAGVVVPVEARVLDLLLFLIRHRDRAVSKDELQDSVWAGRIVTEAALTRAIMKARRVIGDDPKRQEMIRTVHGHGYRFVAPVGTASGPGVTATRARLARLGALWPVVWIGLLALIAVGALYVVRQPGSAPNAVAVLPIQDRTGSTELSWVRLGLMEYVNRLVAEATGRRGVSSRRVLDLVSGQPTQADLQELRQRLGASHLVAAELAQSDGGLTLRYRVARAGGITSAEVSGSDPTSIARHMVQQLVATLPGGGLRRQFRSVSADPFVNEAYARGLALQLQGEIARAREFFEVAVSQAPELFWPRYELALCMRDMGELDAAGKSLEQLLEHPETVRDPAARAAVNMALAQVQRRMGQLESAVATLESVLSMPGLNDSRVETLVRINLGIVLRQLDRHEAARRHLLEALAQARDTAEPVPGSIYQSLGQIERDLGNLELALDYYHRARDAFEADGNRRFAAASTNAMARVHHRLGQFSEAEASLKSALAEREALGDRFGLISTHQALAALYRDAGLWSEAAHHADTALAQAERTDSTSEVVSLLADRIQIALLAGDPETARAALARWQTDYADHGNPERRQVLADWAALATTPGSAALWNRLEAHLAEASSRAQLDISIALALHAPDHDSRVGWLERALESAEALRQYGLALTLRARLASELLAADREADARALIESISNPLGDWPALAEVTARMETVGRFR